jgi:hypothetical protein
MDLRGYTPLPRGSGHIRGSHHIVKAIFDVGGKPLDYPLDLIPVRHTASGQDVVKGAVEGLGRVAYTAQASVAVVAQHTANLVCPVAVVNVSGFMSEPDSISAEFAAALLGHVHLRVLFGSDPVGAPEIARPGREASPCGVVVSAPYLAEILFPVFG